MSVSFQKSENLGSMYLVWLSILVHLITQFGYWVLSRQGITILTMDTNLTDYLLQGVAGLVKFGSEYDIWKELIFKCCGEYIFKPLSNRLGEITLKVRINSQFILSQDGMYCICTLNLSLYNLYFCRINTYFGTNYSKTK